MNRDDILEVLTEANRKEPVTPTDAARQKAWELVNEFVAGCERSLTESQLAVATALVDWIAAALTEAAAP